MADTPQFLTLKRNRDLVGMPRRPWVRWALVALVAAVVVLGALNVFGQQAETTVVDADAARLEVFSPDALRSGLLFMSRFVIDAKQDLDEATLVLDPGWLEGVTLNTVEPAPVGDARQAVAPRHRRQVLAVVTATQCVGEGGKAERQQRKKRGYRERRGKLIFVVEDLDMQRHRVGLTSNVT